METTGEVHTHPLLWGGIQVSLITTFYGLIAFAVSSLIWFGLRQWHRRAILREA